MHREAVRFEPKAQEECRLQQSTHAEHRQVKGDYLQRPRPEAADQRCPPRHRDQEEAYWYAVVGLRRDGCLQPKQRQESDAPQLKLQ